MTSTPNSARTRTRRPSPTRTVVLLVRHGRTPTTGMVLPGRAPGLHLSDDGRAEAKAAAARIARLPAIAAVYASPIERARETAAPIARECGLRVRTERGLVEVDTGEWTGAAIREVAKLPEWATVQRNPSSFRFPGGESFVEMQARVVHALHAITDRHRGETVVAVSHADPIKMALSHALGLHIDLHQRLAVSTASISAIAFGGPGVAPAVLAVNSTGDDLSSLVRAS